MTLRAKNERIRNDLSFERQINERTRNELRSEKQISERLKNEHNTEKTSQCENDEISSKHESIESAK